MKTPALLAALLLLAACTLEQRVTSGREWAQTECNRIIDHADRNRCMERADGAYGAEAVERRVPPPR